MFYLKDVTYQISMQLLPGEFNLLLNALSFYSISSGVLHYGEEIEDCNDIRYKIMRNLELFTKENN